MIQLDAGDIIKMKKKHPCGSYEWQILKTGADIKFINLSGGVGVAYKPEQTPNDIAVIGEGVHKVYDEVLTPAGMGDVAIYTELGRFMLAP